MLLSLQSYTLPLLPVSTKMRWPFHIWEILHYKRRRLLLSFGWRWYSSKIVCFSIKHMVVEKGLYTGQTDARARQMQVDTMFYVTKI
jgi:hypothetical protein